MFRHIKTRFLVITTLISILFLTSFIVGTYRIYGSHVINVSLQDRNSSTQASSRLIEKIVNNHFKSIKMLASNPSLINRPDIFNTILSFNAYNGYYNEIAYIDPTGKAFYSDGTILELGDRPYIKKVLAGNTAISDLIISRKTGGKVIMAAVPVYRGNSQDGALVGRILMEELVESIATIHPKDDVIRVILSSGGQLIFSDEVYRNREPVFTPEVLNNYLQKSTLLTGNSFLDIHYQGAAYYVTTASINSLGWLVYEIVPKKTVREPIQKILISVSFVTIPLIILFSLIVFLVTNRTSSLILSIVDMFESGAKGDFEQRAEIKRIDEYGRLLQSYNKLMDTIDTLMYFDPDTSLPNKKVLLQEIENYRQDDSKKHLGLICISIYGLEKIKNSNIDDFESLLDKIIKGIKTLFPVNSTFYKYTSETFILLIPDGRTLKENDVSGRLSSYLGDIQGYSHYGNSVRISSGIYLQNEYNSYINPLDAVIAAAKYSYDKQIKTHVFNGNTLENLNNDDELRQDLVIALKNKELFLEFQPIVDIDSGKIAKCEALIRWNQNGKGLISPEKFISAAEASSIIIDIDFFVIENVCRLISEAANRDRIIISVNITSRTFEYPDFIPRLRSIIKRYSVPPKCIQFEITERLMMKNTQQNIRVLEELKRMDFKVALDDFGVGYSSLSYLSTLPVDIIKIDRSFIKQISSCRQAKLLIKGIIQMAAIMKLEVIAEGIEQENEIEFLSENGCYYGQGFYYSPAVSFYQLQFAEFLPVI